MFRGHVPIPLGLGTPCGKVSPHVPDTSLLRALAPCLRPFYEAAPDTRLLRLFTRFSCYRLPDNPVADRIAGNVVASFPPERRCIPRRPFMFFSLPIVSTQIANPSFFWASGSPAAFNRSMTEAGIWNSVYFFTSVSASSALSRGKHRPKSPSCR